MYNRLCLKILFLFLIIISASCKFEQLDNKNEIKDQIEQNTVKRFTEKQIMQEAQRLGDSITMLADSLLLAKITASGGKIASEKLLQEYSPENEARVKAISQHFKITPKQVPADIPITKQTEVKMLNQAEIEYTRPVGSQQPEISSGKSLPIWQFPIQRRVVLETLALKRGKSQRIRHLFTKTKK